MSSPSESGAPAAPSGRPAPIQHPPGYRARRFRNWLLLGLLYAGYYLCRYNLGAVAPEMGREYNLDNAKIGMLSTVRDVGYAVGNFVNGLFADMLGGKQAMAVGALSTIVLNLIFGFLVGGVGMDIAVLLLLMYAVRALDGYAQSFGAPGMVKTNAAWFRREERGKFAGLFGLVIQLGNAAANSLSGLLVTGASIVVGGITLTLIPQLGWKAMFFVPPAIVAVLLVAMWLGVKNYPEEAWFQIQRDESEGKTAGQTGPSAAAERLPLGLVVRTIARNPLTWINASAYFCTGFVRRASDFWWPKYLDNVWHLGKDSDEFRWLAILLPLSAVGGSFFAGWLSDTFFRSRRSPVAAALYTIETAVILGTWLLLANPSVASAPLACVALVMISFTCNSSHSIIGTAAVMDIGGPRMAGFTLGVVNFFQYLGSILAGYGLGLLIDVTKDWDFALTRNWNAAFGAMLPFSALGMILMIRLWLKTRGKDVRGA
jgi:OPA family glycerol-3-phosphate transporter-like MFS transporter